MKQRAIRIQIQISHDKDSPGMNACYHTEGHQIEITGRCYPRDLALIEYLVDIVKNDTKHGMVWWKSGMQKEVATERLAEE